MKMTVYEGSVDEIAILSKKLNENLSSVSEDITSVEELPTEMQGEDSEETKFVSVEVARRVLSRRDLSPSIMTMLKALYDAHPEWLSGPELRKLCSYTTAQFRGAMGAFQRRVTHTEGFEKDSLFLNWDWIADGGYYCYSLPDSVREALELEKLV